jgi:two-component system, NarL family, sensor histidine kinase DevS
MDRATRGILELARSVLGKLDLDEVLNQVLRAAHDLTDARYAALGVLNESKTELARFLTVGIDDATRDQIGALPRGRGVLGALIDHPSPLRLDDVGSHPLSYGFPVAHPPMRSFLGVPILVAGEPYGNLYLTEKAGGAQFARGGFGLLGIEERVALLDGEVEIESAPGQGAVVRAHIPAQRRAEDAPRHAEARA